MFLDGLKPWGDNWVTSRLDGLVQAAGAKAVVKGDPQACYLLSRSKVTAYLWDLTWSYEIFSWLSFEALVCWWLINIINSVKHCCVFFENFFCVLICAGSVGSGRKYEVRCIFFVSIPNPKIGIGPYTQCSILLYSHFVSSFQACKEKPLEKAGYVGVPDMKVLQNQFDEG